jgi:hypothetical protein
MPSSRTCTSAVLFGILLVPALALAATGQANPPAKSAQPVHATATPPPSPTAARPAVPATHTTHGTVKSLDATRLVLSDGHGKMKEMAFVLNPSTQREGNVAVGSKVAVRYRTEGSDSIAIAITAEGTKAPK